MTTRSSARETQPLLVLVGGGPGTGKTTLARALRDRVGLPVVSKDEIKVGLKLSGVDVRSTDVMYRVVELLLAEGVSCIADHTFERGSEGDFDRHWRDRARVVVLWCICTDPATRLETRLRAEGAAAHEIERSLHNRRDFRDLWAEPPDFGVKVLVVDTDDANCVERAYDVVRAATRP